MARWLILDTTAVEAFTDPRSRSAAARRALAITTVAQREFARLVVPTAVLVEVYRGTGSDAAVDRIAGRLANTVALDVRTARLAGRLRTRAGRGSAVDAVVVATAVRLGGGIVATADVEDITALAAEHANVKVWSLADLPR